MNEIKVSEGGQSFELHSKRQLSPKVMKQFPKYELTQSTPFIYKVEAGPNAAFILNALRERHGFLMDEEASTLVDKLLPLVPTPTVFLFDETHLGLEYPSIPFYINIAERLYLAQKSYTIGTVAFSRTFEVLRLITSLQSWLPGFTIEDSVRERLLTPLENFDGTLPSVLQEEVSNLITASHAYRLPVDNFEKAGYSHLSDLLINKPRRYIDKTAVLDRSTWVKGEDITFIGKVTGKTVIKEQHSSFALLVQGSEVKCIFWRRPWMENKFAVGEEVLILGRWDGRQVNGASMDSLLEASVLPIVPIYSQSSKFGISSKVIMNCIYEIFERYSEKGSSLASYISNEGLSLTLTEAIKELHFPSSSGSYKAALDVLAYYELVYMQLLLLHKRTTETKASGSPKPEKIDGLVSSAIQGLPFELTSAQREAISQISMKLASNVAEEILLSADVGSGKGLLEDELVATPSGWKKIGDLRAGMYVIGRNGLPTKVVGVYPQKIQQVARVTFSDGESIVTDLEHRWALTPTSDLLQDNSYIVSTGQLLARGSSASIVDMVPKDALVDGKHLVTERIVSTEFASTKGTPRWKVPLVSAPVEYSGDPATPIPPYLLGLWLGNSSKLPFVFSNANPALIEKISGAWRGEIVEINSSTIKIESTSPFENADYIGRDGKRIPPSILTSKLKVRLKILEGIIDSETVRERGTDLLISTPYKTVLDNTRELVQSVGGLIVNVPADSEETALFLGRIILPKDTTSSLKSQKLREYETKESDFYRTIVNVQSELEDARTVCIKVDADDELFVTRSYIVTHNTLVAQLTCLQSVDNGYQAVLAGPTEVLARQLYDTFTSLLSGIPQSIRPTIVYLSGETKAREKKEIYKAIESGDIDLIVGTHSVLSESVPYKELGVVVIDEQQKFGASQRNSLHSLSKNGKKPDLLTQTATPIPRSTAQVYYGDIDLITIDQKPKGRLPIITEWVREDPNSLLEKETHEVWGDIKAEAKLGHKTFIVVPMVYENNKLNIASVENTVKALKRIAPSLSVEYIHGQMKKAEQNERMTRFRDESVDVLVASTVIEVGVDVSSATRVLILSADRMGASSLHQIRGRVGRNSLQSKCYLVSDSEKESTATRLNSLVESNNGFEIATVDLHTRGEGDLFGEKQSGDTNFNFISLVDHTDLIEKAKAEAKSIYLSPRRFEALEDALAVLKRETDEERK